MFTLKVGDFEIMRAVYPFELPIPLEHPDLDGLLGQLRFQGTPLSVPLADDLMPLENCYWNVLHLTEKYGGEIVFGWMIKHWPGLYLSAEHHAVWHWPDSGMLDVTARMPESPVATTFLMDANQKIDVSVPPNIPIQYFPISSDDRVSLLIDLSAQLSRVTQRVNDLLAIDLGLCVSSQIAIAQGRVPKGLQMTSQQHQCFRELQNQSEEVRLEIGTLIESLLSRPPNKIARAATKSYLEN
ncbi:MAG: hypothetical protein AB8B91_15250 [Rubripirellula sp.]